jgi:pSer/pThr/pTyr-binding forkhead associated (FHA) protein
MFQLRSLSGKQAGAVWSANRFPVRVGRSPQSDIPLQDDGVWEEHCEIELDDSNSFVVRSKSEGLVSVNQQRSNTSALRNGDVIELGSAKLQFWLAEVSQGSLQKRELAFWILVTFVCLAQIAIIYLLLD